MGIAGTLPTASGETSQTHFRRETDCPLSTVSGYFQLAVDMSDRKAIAVATEPNFDHIPNAMGGQIFVVLDRKGYQRSTSGSALHCHRAAAPIDFVDHRFDPFLRDLRSRLAIERCRAASEM